MEMVNGKIGFLEFFDSGEENIDGSLRLFELICRGVMGLSSGTTSIPKGLLSDNNAGVSIYSLASKQSLEKESACFSDVQSKSTTFAPLPLHLTSEAHSPTSPPSWIHPRLCHVINSHLPSNRRSQIQILGHALAISS
ncbi:hypothetical protein D5086_020544 [Populus alba]